MNHLMLIAESLAEIQSRREENTFALLFFMIGIPVLVVFADLIWKLFRLLRGPRK